MFILSAKKLDNFLSINEFRERELFMVLEISFDTLLGLNAKGFPSIINRLPCEINSSSGCNLHYFGRWTILSESEGVFLSQAFPDFQSRIVFGKVPRLRPYVLPVKTMC